MKKTAEGRIRVRHHALIDHVLLCAGPKGDEVDIMTQTLLPFEGHDVRITIEDIGG